MFELEDNQVAVAKVHDLTGDLEMSLAISRQGRRYTAKVTGATKPWSILMRNKTRLHLEDELDWSREDTGVRIVPSSGSVEFSFSVS